MIKSDYTVKEEEENKRIDKLLVDLHPGKSRTEIQKLIVDKHFTVNGHGVKANYKCQINDVIVGEIPIIKPLSIVPEDIPLKIIYEDEYLLIVNKPSGMVVHPTDDHQTGTLVHALLHHCDNLSKTAGVERQGIVHRIDKDTSGLLVVAKNDAIHTALAKQFFKKEVERKYEAIVHGLIEHERGLIDAPIGRDPKNRLRMAVVDHGKDAITHFEVLKRYELYSHIECRLETGRTHQIRVHMDYIDHPLVGDPKYTEKNVFDVVGQALFAKSLSFIHPIKNERISFEIGQPTEFQTILNKIEETT